MSLARDTDADPTHPRACRCRDCTTDPDASADSRALDDVARILADWAARHHATLGDPVATYYEELGAARAVLDAIALRIGAPCAVVAVVAAGREAA